MKSLKSEARLFSSRGCGMSPGAGRSVRFLAPLGAGTPMVKSDQPGTTLIKNSGESIHVCICQISAPDER